MFHNEDMSLAFVDTFNLSENISLYTFVKLCSEILHVGLLC